MAQRDTNGAFCRENNHPGIGACCRHLCAADASRFRAAGRPEGTAACSPHPLRATQVAVAEIPAGICETECYMFIQRQPEETLRPDQVRTMATGLYHLANIDGISDEEKRLIQDFLKDGNVDLDVENLASLPFSLDEILYSLDTIFLRKTFVRACVLLAKVDGRVSAEEMAELRRIAQAVGIDEPFDSLVADLDNKRLE